MCLNSQPFNDHEGSTKPTTGDSYWNIQISGTD